MSMRSKNSADVLRRQKCIISIQMVARWIAEKTNDANLPKKKHNHPLLKLRPCIVICQKWVAMILVPVDLAKNINIVVARYNNPPELSFMISRSKLFVFKSIHYFCV